MFLYLIRRQIDDHVRDFLCGAEAAEFLTRLEVFERLRGVGLGLYPALK